VVGWCTSDMYIGPHVTCLAFVYGCNKTEILWSDISKNFNTKFHENPSSGQTDRQICRLALKWFRVPS